MFNHGLTHRLLNLALSGDAELSEQLSDARAEDVFLRRAHLRSLGYLSLAPRPTTRAAVRRRAIEAGSDQRRRQHHSTFAGQRSRSSVNHVAGVGATTWKRLMAVEREADRSPDRARRRREIGRADRLRRERRGEGRVCRECAVFRHQFGSDERHRPMAISSNPLRSPRTALGSRRPQSLDYLVR